MCRRHVNDSVKRLRHYRQNFCLSSVSLGFCSRQNWTVWSARYAATSACMGQFSCIASCIVRSEIRYATRLESRDVSSHIQSGLGNYVPKESTHNTPVVFYTALSTKKAKSFFAITLKVVTNFHQI